MSAERTMQDEVDALSNRVTTLSLAYVELVHLLARKGALTPRDLAIELRSMAKALDAAGEAGARRSGVDWMDAIIAAIETHP